MDLAFGVSALEKKKIPNMRKIKTFFVLMLAMIAIGELSSCAPSYLGVRGIAYQSIRSKNPIDRGKIPEKAKIIMAVKVDANGNIDVEVQNNTDEVMTIDRTKSFFRGCDGISTAYYDPTVNVLAQTTTNGQMSGASVNLGSVARATGVGGVAGTLLSGVTVGGANENSTSTTNTTYFVDQPKIAIAPHSKASMGRVFHESRFDIDGMADLAQSTMQEINQVYTSEGSTSPYSCSVTVSYSIDNEKTFDKVDVSFYSNSLIVSHVQRKGYVNDALRAIYMAKSDLFDEDWYTLCFGGDPWKNSLKDSKSTNYNAFKYKHGIFYNYK